MTAALQAISQVVKWVVRYVATELASSASRIATNHPNPGWETTARDVIKSLWGRFLTWVRSLGEDGSTGLAAVA